jgi:serine/threonine-protein kinase
MGVVYKARQMGLERLVALKMILASHLASADQVRRFHAEAQAAARLSHPHILQVHEAGEVLGQHYFAMHYVDGVSLLDWLRGRPLAVDQTVGCLIQVARAVGYLHAHGIVHRDLKPANILLDKHGWPYVSDFGLAKLLEADSQLTGSGMIVGTPSYMSPEQAAGKHAAIGPRSDLYSLGAILYEMLTGRPPFREAAPLDTLVQVLESEPARPSQLNRAVPRELELICLKCLAKTPEERYASADELADDLERFSRCDVVQARPRSWWQNAQRWLRQEPGLACRLFVLALAGFVIHINYRVLHPVSVGVHASILSILTLWAVVSLGCQSLLRQEYRPGLVRHVWLGTDALLLTTAIGLAGAVNSPLLVTYALLIVASGLWFRVGLVWFTTGMAIAGYLVLMSNLVLHGGAVDAPHHHVIFLVGLVALGLMVAYQVKRVRALSCHYETRRLP